MRAAARDLVPTCAPNRWAPRAVDCSRAPRRTMVLDRPAELGKLRLEPRRADHVRAVVGAKFGLAPRHGRPDDGTLLRLDKEAGMRHVCVVDLENTTTPRCAQARARACALAFRFNRCGPARATPAPRARARAPRESDLACDARPVRPDARLAEEPDLLHSRASLGAGPAPGTHALRSRAIDREFAASLR